MGGNPTMSHLKFRREDTLKPVHMIELLCFRWHLGTCIRMDFPLCARVRVIDKGFHADEPPADLLNLILHLETGK